MLYENLIIFLKYNLKIAYCVSDTLLKDYLSIPYCVIDA